MISASHPLLRGEVPKKYRKARSRYRPSGMSPWPTKVGQSWSLYEVQPVSRSEYAQCAAEDRRRRERVDLDIVGIKPIPIGPIAL